MLNFTTAAQALAICDDEGITLAEAMQRREEEISGLSREKIRATMRRSLTIMLDGATAARKQPMPSMGGLIGGESHRFQEAMAARPMLSGDFISTAVAAAMSVMEVNASMGRIVAAPTAGSAGIVPGIITACREVLGVDDERLIDALFTAGAIGWFATYNGSISGAEGGCQAETGTASAMAAGALTELRGGTPEQATHAAALCLSNLLGIVCDPVGGLVEAPCQMRNTMGVAAATTASDIILSGTPFLTPLDEMIDVVMRVGRQLPAELRETGLGGLASAPSACARCTIG